MLTKPYEFIQQHTKYLKLIALQCLLCFVSSRININDRREETFWFTFFFILKEELHMNDKLCVLCRAGQEKELLCTFLWCISCCVVVVLFYCFKTLLAKKKNYLSLNMSKNRQRKYLIPNCCVGNHKLQPNFPDGRQRTRNQKSAAIKQMRRKTETRACSADHCSLLAKSENDTFNESKHSS